MVISPKEIKEWLETRATRKEKEQIASIEENIDTILKDGRNSVPATIFPSAKIRDKVIAMYECAGWRISYFDGLGEYPSAYAFNSQAGEQQ